MILAIGEILFDIFPKYRRIGGAPYNFAYHIKQMGWPVRFISRIGKDENGRAILSSVKAAGLHPEDLQIDDHRDTGKVTVSIDNNGNHQFDIVKNTAYDQLELDESMMRIIGRKPELLYFGTLIQRTNHGFRTVQHLLEIKPETTRCFYDINLRPGCWNRSIIAASLEYTDVLKLNAEELDTLGSIINRRGETADVVRFLMDRYKIEMVAVTHGKSGSELFTSGEHYETDTVESVEFIDSVGAGDAFAAVLAIGYLQKRQPGWILDRASRFASRICGIEGAVPSDINLYSGFRKGDLND